MAYCSKCGAYQEDGAKFCTECGEKLSGTPVPPVRSSPQVKYPTEKRVRKKSIFKRWWFWVLVVFLIASVFPKSKSTKQPVSTPAATVAVATPRPTPKPTATPAPTPTPEPEEEIIDEMTIRPEIKEFLDSYEAFMDEYVAFMQTYMSGGMENMVAMMGEYTNMLSRYEEFTEALDSMDEEAMTNAELYYYLEVTNRVSQKLLNVAAG